MIQQQFDFSPMSSNSPINNESLSKQNRLVYNHLLTGQTINCIQAQDMGITALNSRISELRRKHNIPIYDRFVTIGNSKVKQYSLKPFRT